MTTQPSHAEAVAQRIGPAAPFGIVAEDIRDLPMRGGKMRERAMRGDLEILVQGERRLDCVGFAKPSRGATPALLQRGEHHERVPFNPEDIA